MHIFNISKKVSVENNRTVTMPALIERPKMSLAMWAALKAHIMKQREKKKQEQEADAAVEQLRREQEMKRKQNAMTLEEIREQIGQLEKKLQALQGEKGEMFLSLKRVLYNDEIRRNEEEKESNEVMQVNHPYSNQNVPVGAANMYLLSNMRGNRNMNRSSGMYKVGTAPPPQQNGALKRPRSPSPPPNTNYTSQGYNYKIHGATYGGPTYSLHQHSNPYSQDQAKHLSANYHVSHMPQPQPGYVGGLPPQIEHPSPKPSNMQDEKYYIQQTGSISSGYPIRSQPQLPSHLPPTHHPSPGTHQSAFYQKVKALREYQRAEGIPYEHVAQNDPNVPIRKEDVMRRNMNNEVHR